MRLSKGDELVAATVIGEGEEAILVSQGGKALHLPLNFPSRHRQAGGIWGMRLEPEDEVVAMERAPTEGHLLTLTESGHAKLTPLSHFRLQGRRRKGLRAHRLTTKTGPLVAARLVVDLSSNILIRTSQGLVLRHSLKDLPSKGRGAVGRLAMQINPQDKIVGLTLLEPD